MSKFKLTRSIASMAEPIFVVAKGTQKGFIFLYEILKASIASLKTCSKHTRTHTKWINSRSVWQIKKEETASSSFLQVSRLRVGLNIIRVLLFEDSFLDGPVLIKTEKYVLSHKQNSIQKLEQNRWLFFWIAYFRTFSNQQTAYQTWSCRLNDSLVAHQFRD